MLELENKDILPFKFKRLKSWKIFISNDVWSWLIISDDEFVSLVKWTNLDQGFKDLLISKWFIKNPKLNDRENQMIQSSKWVNRNQHFFYWPNLHIIVVSLNCNYACLYCHASSRKWEENKFNMSRETAKKVVDTIFQTSSWYVNIEFQWWEPLVNWDLIKYIIEYAKEKNLVYNLNLYFNIITNLSLMDEEKLTYLLDNNVWISTSLDWNQEVHDYNRKFVTGKWSYEIVTHWIKRINEELKKRNKSYKIWTVATVTKKSLSFAKDIIDSYIELGLDRIFIRPVNPYWFAGNLWKTIWYTQKEYLDFYNELLKYIETKSQQGFSMTDTYSAICKQNLQNIQRSLYTEEMWPVCWASLKQVAYNWDGWIYTCDEGRMLADAGNEQFKIWQIDLNKSADVIYKEYILSYATKLTLYSSMIDFQPGYETHPYSSFIWLCPIYSYVTTWNLDSKYKKDERFKLQEWTIEKLLWENN